MALSLQIFSACLEVVYSGPLSLFTAHLVTKKARYDITLTWTPHDRRLTWGTDDKPSDDTWGPDEPRTDGAWS